MKTILAIIVGIIIVEISLPSAAEGNVSPDIARQLPAGYHVIASAHLAAGKPVRSYEIVVLGRNDEDSLPSASKGAPARPLIVFEKRDGQFVAAGRNDHVVMKADEGGQCDPFLDGDATIALKGRYFTIENGVACGQHWTDYISFRLDDLTGSFVFDNERREAWELNPSNDPSAEVLVRAGPPRTIRGRSGKPTPFVAWRPTELRLTQ
ncbi:hypothetical protein [Rhizobium sp. 11515TR]|jgi:hypothetical protein|uniref:hypothetical protein n=1 Tax=Rhizobium sp. 11515TR TaxID=2028343 RepID=UPI000BA858F8|nr:hypothetical protein [Rhizobium sp. 11515TR]ASW09950.1 hypothetical protein CKA34_28475 [Rhizobium sp. 11515TR]